MSDRKPETVIVMRGGSSGWIAAVLIAIAAVGAILYMAGMFASTTAQIKNNAEQPTVEKPADPASAAPAAPAAPAK